MPRYLTSSTFWYSGIFAAAATFDAGAKQQRREKWDQAIAEVKQELARPQVVKGEHLTGLEKQNDAVSAEEERRVSFTPFAEEGEEEGFRYTDGKTRAHWPANTGASLNTRRLPLDSIYADDWQRANAAIRTWTPKKLAMVQTSADILLLEIVQELQACGEARLANESVPEDFASTLLQDAKDVETQITAKYERMKILRRADTGVMHYSLREAEGEALPVPQDTDAICRYSQDVEGKYRSIQHELNMSLQHVFQLYSRDKISKAGMLGKICYNLSRSSAPPNLNTFNTLLLGFSRANEANLVRRVVGSFRRCHMRPNEITLATILNHFTKNDDSIGFAHWVELIRGGNNGLALARPDIAITDAGRSRLTRHPEHPERIIQLPCHTPIVFGAIIAGVVKFTGFDAALQICQSMGREGWGLCMGGLTSLLQDCAQRGDWDSGMAVWKQIQALKAKSRRKEDSRWLSERIRLNTFATMLRLCSRCDRRDVFEEVWQQALNSHRGAKEKLTALVKLSSGERDAVDESIAKAVKAGRKRVAEPQQVGRRTEKVKHWGWAASESVTGPTEVAPTDARSDEQQNARLQLASGCGSTEIEFQIRESEVQPEWDEQTSAPGSSKFRRPLRDYPAGAPVLKPPDAVYDMPLLSKQKGGKARRPQRQVQEEELHGLMPLSHELDDYEMRERPMALRA